MATDNQSNVPRRREPPHPEDVLDAMTPGRCYVVADLVAAFEDDSAPAPNTIRSRLNSLAAAEAVDRREHTSGLVTYRRVEADD